MDVEITKSNGQSTKLSELDVEVRDFVVESIEMLPRYNGVEGRNGVVDMGATYGTRTIRVPFYFKAKDLHDVALLRDELFGLVSNIEPFYVREMRRMKHHPGYVFNNEDDYDNLFVGGKRYKVRLASVFDIDQIFEYGFGELVFETIDLPFAESIGTTLDIEQNGINANDEIWGFGMGLEIGDTAFRYTVEATSHEHFYIYNAGNVVVHPFEQYLKITIKDVEGSTEQLRFFNQTNGSYVHVEEEVDPTDVIVFDGANVTKNDLQYFRKTRRTFIHLEPGWNRFQLYWCDSATIEFDFRYYYL